MLRFASLFSGSSGNSLYIENEDTAILVDVGRSAKQTEQALRALGREPGDLQGIVLTHEHIDHVSGVSVLARRYGLPVYASEGTLRGANFAFRQKMNLQAIRAGTGFAIGGLRLVPVAGSHDANEPLCFRVTCLQSAREMAVVTDLGYVPAALAKLLCGVQGAYIESNHDEMMLRTGPYPYVLKQRVASDRGHLSNRACAEFCVQLARTGAMQFLLGHLSEQNNTPMIAHETTSAQLSAAGFAVGRDVALHVAPRSSPSGLISLGEEEAEVCNLFASYALAP